MKLTVTKIYSFRQLININWFILASLLFRFLLELSYVLFVNPIFEYAGFSINFQILKYIESWLFFIFFIILSPKKLNRVSDYLLVFLLFYFITPLLVFYGLAGASRDALHIVLLGVSLILIFRRGALFKIPLVKGGRIIASCFVAVGVIFVTVWMAYSGGIDYFNINLMRVYEFRSDVGELINQGVMGYLNVWATKVFGPFLMAIFLWKKKYFMAFTIFCFHIFWFGISSHKGILFYPFVVIFVWLFFRSSKELFFIPIFVSLVVGISLSVYIFFDEIWLATLLVRRVLFVPPFLTFTYYDFFSHNQFIYWSNSITRGFIDYPYDINPARLIGNYLGVESNSNNSFLATGYMHAGIPGVIFYGVLVGLLFRLIDSVANKGIPSWFAVAVIVVPSESLLTSADLPTALLTHGLGMAIVLMFLYRMQNKMNTS